MKRKLFTNISIAILSSFALTSCLNDDGDVGDIRNGYISFVNAMPDTSALDFYVSTSQQIRETDLLGNEPLPFTERFPSSSYVPAQQFRYLITVGYPHGELDTVLEQGTIQVAGDTYYSLYIYSSADSVKGMVQQDDLETPTSGMAKVRFMNLGQGTPEVDLVANGSDTWFAGYEFEEISDEYEEIPAGTYSVEIMDSGTADVLSTGSVELEDSKVYSIWVRGILGETSVKALGIETIEHIPVETNTPAQ